jgi:hypothetical protein
VGHPVLLPTMVLNCCWNVAHDVGLLNLGGCNTPTSVPVLPQDPSSASTWTSASCVLNSCCVVSTRVLVISISTRLPWILRLCSS